MDLTNDGTVLNCIRSTPDLDLSFNSDFNSFLDLDLSLPASVAGINTSDLGAVVDNSHNINSRPNNVHRSLQLNNFVADYAVTNCPNCAQIKAMYERQYQDHRYNTQLLKKRIISTDKLLRRYKFKQNECEHQAKIIQFLNTQIEKMNRDADILACQLQSLLVEVNPLKEEKTALEEKLKTKAFEMERLADRIECNEALFRQRRAVDDLNKKLEVELGNVKRSNSKLVTKFNALTSSHYDLKRVKKSLLSRVSVNEKRLSVCAKSLAEGQDLVRKYWRILKENGLTGDNRPNIIPNGYQTFLKQAIAGKLTETEETEKNHNNSELQADSNDDFDNDSSDENDDVSSPVHTPKPRNLSAKEDNIKQVDADRALTSLTDVFKFAEVYDLLSPLSNETPSVLEPDDWCNEDVHPSTPVQNNDFIPVTEPLKQKYSASSKLDLTNKVYKSKEFVSSSSSSDESDDVDLQHRHQHLKRKVASAPKDTGTNVLKEIVASDAKDTGTNVLKEIVASAPKDTGTNVLKEIVASDAKDTGTNVLKEIVASDAKDIGTNVLKEIVASDAKDTGTNVLKEIVASDAKDIGTNVLKEIVASDAKDTGTNVLKEIVASDAKDTGTNVLKEIVASDAKDTGTNVLKEIVASDAKDTGTNVLKEIVASDAKDTGTNVLKEIVASAPKDTGTNVLKEIVASAPKKIKLSKPECFDLDSKATLNTLPDYSVKNTNVWPALAKNSSKSLVVSDSVLTADPVNSHGNQMSVLRTSSVNSHVNQMSVLRTDPVNSHGNQMSVPKADPVNSHVNQMSVLKADPVNSHVNQMSVLKADPVNSHVNQMSVLKADPVNSHGNQMSVLRTDPVNSHGNQMSVLRTDPVNSHGNQMSVLKADPVHSHVNQMSVLKADPVNSHVNQMSVLKADPVNSHVNQMSVLKADPVNSHVNQMSVLKADPVNSHGNQMSVPKADPVNSHGNQMSVLKADPVNSHVNQMSVLKADPVNSHGNQMSVLKADPVNSHVNQMSVPKADPVNSHGNQMSVLKTGSVNSHVNQMSVLKADPVNSHVNQMSVPKADPVNSHGNQMSVLKTGSVNSHVNQMSVLKADPVNSHVNQMSVLKADPVNSHVNQMSVLKADPVSNKLPVGKKRKLTFDWSSISLTHIFNFFTIPRPISPLPTSPIGNEDSCDSLVKFDSTTPTNVIRVTPKAHPQPSTPADVPQINLAARLQPGNVKTKVDSLSHQIMEARSILAKRKASILIKPQAISSAFKTAKCKAESASETPDKPTGLNTEERGPDTGNTTVKRRIQNTSNVTVQDTIRGKDTAKHTKQDTIKDTMKDTRLDTMKDTLKDARQGFIKDTVKNTKQDREKDKKQDTVKVTKQDTMKCTRQDTIKDTVNDTRQDTEKCTKQDTVKCTRQDTIKDTLKDTKQDTIKDTVKDKKGSTLKDIWTAIFSRKTKSSDILSLCSLFTQQCKDAGDLDQARILLYKIAWCGYLDLAGSLLAIIEQWPAVLTSSSIFSVIKFITHDKLKAEPERLKQLEYTFEGLYDWRKIKVVQTAEALLKSFQEKLMATVKLGDRDKVHELSLAMELLLAHKGDKWSEDQFIKRLIVSSTMKFVDNKTAEETAAKSAVVSCLLNIFISVQRIQACSSNTVSILVSQVLTKLIHKQSEDMSLELSVVEALIRASPYCPVKCLDLMKKWQDTNKGRIPAHTFSKLQFVRSTLSKMVPGKNICKS